VRGAIRREWQAPAKDRKAAMDSWGRCLRPRREALIRCVTLLGKGAAIAGAASRSANRFLAR